MALNINKFRNDTIDSVTKTLNKAKAKDKEDPTKVLVKALNGRGFKPAHKRFLVALINELSEDTSKIRAYKLLFDLDLEHQYKLKMVEYMHKVIEENGDA